jgi:hypothetical protein
MANAEAKMKVFIHEHSAETSMVVTIMFSTVSVEVEIVSGRK